MDIDRGIRPAFSGMFSALAPFPIEWYHFTSTQVLILAAMEPLFAAATSIPLGIWADKYGGRTVFNFACGSLCGPDFGDLCRELLRLLCLIRAWASGVPNPFMRLRNRSCSLRFGNNNASFGPARSCWTRRAFSYTDRIV